MRRRRRMRWTLRSHRTGVGRKLCVPHRSGRPACRQVRPLLRFQRTAWMLLHGRRFLLQRQFRRRRWSSGHQCRTRRRRPIDGGCRRCARRFVRSRAIVGNRRSFMGRWRLGYRPLVSGRRVRLVGIARRRVGASDFARPHILRRHILRGARRLSGMDIRGRRMRHNCRPLRGHRRSRGLGAGYDGFRRGIDLRMRNHLRPGKLLRIDLHQVARDRFSVTKCVRRNGGHRYRLIAVMNVVDVGDIRDVGNVDVAHVGHVDLPQIDIAVVIPGIERFAWTERKPRCHSANAKANRESWSADKGNESRSVDWCYRDGTRQPSPARTNLHPSAIVEGSKSPRRIIQPGPAPRLDPNPAAVAIRNPSHSHA